MLFERSLIENSVSLFEDSLVQSESQASCPGLHIEPIDHSLRVAGMDSIKSTVAFLVLVARTGFDFSVQTTMS